MYKINLFEGIEDEIIQKSLQNIKENLHRVPCSHFKYHCGQTDEFLQNRIYEENKRDATSFYTENMKEVRKICIETMRDNWDEVAGFLCCGFIDCSIQKDFHKSLGFGYLAGVQGVFEDLHRVRVCLKKDEATPCGFRVTSVHLVITRDIQPDESVEWLREEAL